VDDQLTVASF